MDANNDALAPGNATTSDWKAEVHADYRASAHALAMTVNCLYHSHRQGVMLCDFPIIAVYDNNGGYPNRELFWSTLRASVCGPRFELICEGVYNGEGTEDGDSVPDTRTMLVRCRYPELGDRIITRDDYIQATEMLRRAMLSLKGTHGIDDGHDVVVLLPQDRRQDEIEAAIRKSGATRLAAPLAKSAGGS